jgi:hypothetical protein
MTAAMLVREPDRDELAEYLEAWRADVLSVPLPPMHDVDHAVAALTEPSDHMPTVPTLRVVEARFPQLVGAVRWATTVGLLGVSVGCFSVAAVLAAGLRTGVIR